MAYEVKECHIRSPFYLKIPFIDIIWGIEVACFLLTYVLMDNFCA